MSKKNTKHEFTRDEVEDSFGAPMTFVEETEEKTFPGSCKQCSALRMLDELTGESTKEALLKRKELRAILNEKHSCDKY